ncbi:MAG TPA: OmpA family protein [Candidatus Hydrogenedentes bacterium]|jgi:outer membrane protein OmpA-like peptidoglycan-associated protein|nr:OmpA family protein [Candidatus Hydrogenedentota bacterium]
MRKSLVGVLTIGVVLMSGAASAAIYQPPKVWDDLSWWGNSGATPEPVKDPVRAAYWWWPTKPASNANDSELWGNRGKVMHTWEKPMEAPPPPEPPKPPVEPPAKKHVAPVLNHILFDFDKAVLKPEGKAEVDKAVAHLKEWPGDTVLIEGHTCDIGEAAYNEGLGGRRANAVKTYMVEAGISADRISTKSFGETQPAVANDSAANRKLNRRAVIVTTLKD